MPAFAGKLFLFCKINLKSCAVGKQHSVREPDAENAGVFVLKIVVSVVNPGGKGLLQRFGNPGVFRLSKIAQIFASAVSGELRKRL